MRHRHCCFLFLFLVKHIFIHFHYLRVREPAQLSLSLSFLFECKRVLYIVTNKYKYTTELQHRPRQSGSFPFAVPIDDHRRRFETNKTRVKLQRMK